MTTFNFSTMLMKCPLYPSSFIDGDSGPGHGQHPDQDASTSYTPSSATSSEHLGTSFSFKANPDLQTKSSLSLVKMLTTKEYLSDGLDHGSK